MTQTIPMYAPGVAYRALEDSLLRTLAEQGGDKAASELDRRDARVQAWKDLRTA